MMELEQLLALATSKQKIIVPKVMGLGGYKATKYTFKNGTTLEAGKGRAHRIAPKGMMHRINSFDIDNIELKRGKETMLFRMPLSELDLGIIERFIKE